MSKSTRWTRKDVANRILAGDSLVILNNNVLRIPQSWLSSHPGGSAAILHFVGRDATDEINAYHDDETLAWISKYSIGVLDLQPGQLWDNFLPPYMAGWTRKPAEDGTLRWYNEATDAGSSSPVGMLVKSDDSPCGSPTLDTITPPPSSLSLEEQVAHSTAYKELHEQIKQKGLYQTPYVRGYGFEFATFILFGAMAAFFYQHNWLFFSACSLGAMWHQIVFTVHDLGHMGVTHDWALDRIISVFLADFIGGLSIGWWVDNHNVHHLVTNHPTHDPDIQHIPFFAISTAFFNNLWSTYYKRTMAFDAPARLFISLQHKLFYVVMSLARFNLYALSYGHLVKRVINEGIKGKRRARGGHWAFSAEVAGIIFFWIWFGRVLYGCGSWSKAIMYLLTSHVVTSPLHVQIVLSHFSMSTEDLGVRESFVHRQLRTTTDVACPPYLAFFHGGLHLQVTHHLFPRLPRHNLHAASLLVKAWTKERGLTYAEFSGFVKGNNIVRGVLRDVAEQIKVIGMVAEGEVKEAMTKVPVYHDHCT